MRIRSIDGLKLPPLPPGDGPVWTVSGGRDSENPRKRVVILSIARAQIEETLDGTLVTTIGLDEREVTGMISDLFEARKTLIERSR